MAKKIAKTKKLTKVSDKKGRVKLRYTKGDNEPTLASLQAQIDALSLEIANLKKKKP